MAVGACGMGGDDRGLAERCLVGDQEACATLVERYARLVGTVIWRATGESAVVEDLAQETFLRVFRGLPEFAARGKLSTWIYTIAHRVAVDHLRERRRKPRGPEATLGELEEPSAIPDPLVVATAE